MTITVTSGFATEALAWDRTRTVSLGSQWRSSAATCGLADLRVYWSADRERP